MKRIVIVGADGIVNNVSCMEEGGIIGDAPERPESEEEILNWRQEALKYWSPPSGETAVVSDDGEVGDIYDSATGTFTTPEPPVEEQPVAAEEEPAP
jgi:hypothetical protein